MDSDEQLEGEQEALDKHDDDTAEMNYSLNRLRSSATPTLSKEKEGHRLLDRKLRYIIGHIASTKAMVDALTEDRKESDPSLLEKMEV